MCVGLLPCGMGIKEAVEGSHGIMRDDCVWMVPEKAIMALKCIIITFPGFYSLG